MSTDEASEPAIDHRLLRSALEFAVYMAAELSKRKPPFDHPSALKSYFNVERLPTSALGRVRRAIESDDSFRAAIAAGAIPELVDPIGRLWLQRPDGWRDEVVLAIAELDRDRESDDGQRALKKSERRRIAAEQATRRAVTDIVAVQAAADASQAEVETLTSRLSTAEQTIEDMRHDLIAARTEARHARDRQAAATEKLAAFDAQRTSSPGTGLDAAPGPAKSPDPGQLSDRLDAPGRAEMRDLAEVNDPTEVPDLAEIGERRRDVAQAAAEAAGLAETLRRAAADVDAAAAAARAAADAISPQQAESADRYLADAPPTRARSPLRLPGGVRRTSDEAAVFLLKAGAAVLVDGYNVAMLAWPGRDLCDQRDALIDASENVARRFGTELTIVFDGATIVGGFAPRRRVIRVRYSPEGVTADDVIRSEVDRIDTAEPVVVVTNDAEIVRDVTAAGANVIASTTFAGLL